MKKFTSLLLVLFILCPILFSACTSVTDTSTHSGEDTAIQTSITTALNTTLDTNSQDSTSESENSANTTANSSEQDTRTSDSVSEQTSYNSTPDINTNTSTTPTTTEITTLDEGVLQNVSVLRVPYANSFVNLFKGAVVVEASASYSSNHAGKLIDNNGWSRWESEVNEEFPAYVVVDFKTKKTFNSYTLMFAGTHGSSRGNHDLNTVAWNVYISDNKTDWILIDSRSDNTAADITVYTTLYTTRYVKLEITNPSRNLSTTAKVYEMHMYNLSEEEIIKNLPEEAQKPQEVLGAFNEFGKSSLDSIKTSFVDEGLKVEINFVTTKTVNAVLGWYLIKDGIVFDEISYISLSEDRKSLTYIIQNIPLSLGENEIYIQMGAKNHTKFTVNNKSKNILGWKYASYISSGLSFTFTTLPKGIMIGQVYNCINISSTEKYSIKVTDIGENNRVDFHCIEGITPQGNIRITINDSFVYFRRESGTFNNGFNFKPGTAVAGLPTLYIDLKAPYETLDPNNISRSYTPATLSLSHNDPKYMQISDLDIEGIKTRGNYSASFSKKPYSMKLVSKRSILGMGAVKNYVLINGNPDKAYLRNYITYWSGLEMGSASALEVRMVNLVINGDFRGLYTLTQKIDDTDNQVDIDTDNGGIIFECEVATRHGDHSQCVDLESGVHAIIHRPQLEELSESEAQAVVAYARSVLGAADNAILGGYDKFKDFINVDSFIDWYLINELTRNYDSNFTSSCYSYYNDADGLLYMGPLWDYHTCYGLQQDGEGAATEMWVGLSQYSWFRILLADPTFKALLIQRYTELRNNGFYESFIDELYKQTFYCIDAINLDMARWPDLMLDGMHIGSNFNGELIHLSDFVYRRIMYFDSMWGYHPK